MNNELYSNYCNIKDFKKIKNRSQIQEKLNTVLKHINETYYADISAKFIITCRVLILI